jgi:hypothetical protein
MASQAANNISESEVSALAEKFATWAGGLSQREQDVLWRVMQAVAGDDAQGYAAPEAGGPKITESSSGPSSSPRDWNREADFSFAFRNAFGGLGLPTIR